MVLQHVKQQGGVVPVLKGKVVQRYTRPYKGQSVTMLLEERAA